MTTPTDPPEDATEKVRAAMGKKQRVTLTLVEGGLEAAKGKPKPKRLPRAKPKSAPAAPFDLYKIEGVRDGRTASGGSADDDGAGDDGPPPAPPGDGRDESGDPHLPDCALEPETDIGNGRRLLIRHGDKLLNVANIGLHVYDGKRWAWDETDSLARKLSHDTVERIGDERFILALFDHEKRLIDEAENTAAELKRLRLLKAEDKTEEQAARQRELGRVEIEAANARKDFRARKQSRARHAKSSAGSSKLDNLAKEAAPYITHKLEEIDADPLAINCENGTLRFRDAGEKGKPLWIVERFDHAREDLISKCCAALYDELAQAPQFETFLERVLPDIEVRAFVQRFLGYCLTGLTHEQVFAFFHGDGHNGKSTLIDIICRILADYSTTVPIETLAGDQRRKGGDATPDLMRMPGSRLVRSSEPESGVKLKEAMIKSLTSDEPILIRALHKDFNEIYPAFKLVVSGNHKPRIDNDDNGMWRRVVLVPWNVQVPKAERDKMLGKKLWDERNGIFAWLVRGTLSYLQEGLNPPKAVLAATEEYRAESNPIGAFLDGFFAFTGDLKNDRMAPGDIFVEYEARRGKQGWPQFQLSTFVKRLPGQAEKRKAVKQKSGGLMFYLGMRVKSDWELEEDALRAGGPPPPSSGDVDDD
jgi:putative DNA primase/helicase